MVFWLILALSGLISFVLDSRGTLSYSRKQGEKFRDSIDLRKTSVGVSLHLLTTLGLLSKHDDLTLDPISVLPKYPSSPRLTTGRNKKRKALVFDSGNTVWHVRCLSSKDFDIWAGALNNFASVRESEDAIDRRPSLDILHRNQSSTGFQEEGGQQHLVTDKNASQLVTLISQMATVGTDYSHRCGYALI